MKIKKKLHHSRPRRQHGCIPGPRQGTILDTQQSLAIQCQISESQLPVTTDNIAYTHYWCHVYPYEESGFTILVPLKRICHLHLKGRCRRGIECQNVHLCNRSFRLGKDSLLSRVDELMPSDEIQLWESSDHHVQIGSPDRKLVHSQRTILRRGPAPSCISR